MTAPSDRAGLSLTRRGLLGSALGLVLAVGTGCTRAPVLAPPATIASLTATVPYYIAHRGGGGDWPEMTAYAYEQASALPGLQALEVSVCLSADGVLVCSHDPDTQRTTGVPGRIADQTWAALSRLQVSAAGTSDPAQPARPLTRLDEVLDRYASRFVLFVEPKVPEAVAPLLARLSAAGAPERIVWKSYADATSFAAAKGRGFGTWCYVLPEPRRSRAELGKLAADPNIDRLGFPVDATDQLITSVVAAARTAGKQTISWPISTRAERDRAIGFGAAGLMTSKIAELLPRTG